jgi:uncharacterized membrane protein
MESEAAMNPSMRMLWLGLTALLWCGALATGATAEKPRALLLFGVYTQWYKLPDALPGYEVKICNARTDGAEHLPSAEELAAYPLVILSDVTADSLPAPWVDALKNHVRRGGALLTLGGPFTYGLGRFNDKKLDETLPVELTVFDLKWEKQGQPFTGAREHPLLHGVDLTGAPMVYWIHQVKPKPGADVVLTAGNHPLLVTGRYGKGRVAAFLGTPLGEPPPGQKPFWEWSGWPTLMANTVAWLMSKQP